MNHAAAKGHAAAASGRVKMPTAKPIAALQMRRVMLTAFPYAHCALSNSGVSLSILSFICL